MTSPRSTARLAGLLYLFIIVSGVGSEAFLRGPLIVAGDASRTVANLASGQLLFRLSIVGDVVMALSDVGVAVLLYYLLEPVSRALSLTAMVFRLVQAAVLSANLLHLHRAAALLDATGIDVGYQQAFIMSLLDAHATGYDVGLFFFGINCLFVGFLVFRSGFVPRALGVMIAAAGVVYLVGSTIRTVTPQWVGPFSAAYAIPLVAEVAFCGWLLTNGVARPVALPADSR